MKKAVTDTKTSIGSTSEKCPEMSQLLETKGIPGLKETVENNDLAKLNLLNGFQMSDNEVISRVWDSKTPFYRTMNRNMKSIKQYWKERNRRKKARQLSSKGYTYTQIAKKLGVSEKTVQRDIKKVSRYYIGQLNKAWRIMQEEKQREWQQQLNGLTLMQQFKLTTRLLGEYMDRKREREYNRHLLKIILDMDNLRHGVFPTLKMWPDQNHIQMTHPIRVRVVLRVDGKDLPYGGFTIG